MNKKEYCEFVDSEIEKINKSIMKNAKKKSESEN